MDISLFFVRYPGNSLNQTWENLQIVLAAALVPLIVVDGSVTCIVAGILERPISLRSSTSVIDSMVLLFLKAGSNVFVMVSSVPLAKVVYEKPTPEGLSM
jgi:hypothetical protein